MLVVVHSGGKVVDVVGVSVGVVVVLVVVVADVGLQVQVAVVLAMVGGVCPAQYGLQAVVDRLQHPKIWSVVVIT